MLLREVEYARPSSVDEAVRLLAAHDGARALAGGQTLVNVMKARAASPDVLVDLGRLEELRAITVSGDTLQLGAMATYTQIMASSEVDGRAADPRRGRRADRGRPGAQPGHDRRQRLLERPDEPPAAAARRARRLDDDPRRGRRAHRAGGGVLPRRLPDRRRRGRAAPLGLGPRRREGRRRLRLDHDRPRRHVHRERRCEPLRRRRRGSCSAASTPCRSWSRPAAADEASVREAVAGAGLEPPSDVHASADYRRHLAGVCAVRAVQQATERGR